MKKFWQIVKDIFLFIPAMITIVMFGIFILFSKDEGELDAY